MLKTILNFKGVEILSRNEQKNIAGGGNTLTYDCEKGDGAVMGQYLTPCINQPVPKCFETVDGDGPLCP
ncbi:hypothetical protein NJT12_19295 [Flavobacterium sp. AC]|uniref:Bacteriocin-type signal sequence-containing protein n=1 Tax=Flavobacterium azizsancarii TaxID=2961580 RepID=A0ABT4WGV2_9FLAO|nr:hypothetical protein [Flavobacterium azizsancarii]MDA6071776.1 hypothetical protein [Flavobacterium azizsancarii]